MKIKKNIIVKISLITLILITIAINSHAAIISNKARFVQGGMPDNTFLEKGAVIAVVIRSVGVSISVLAMAIMGIRYMLGSVEERAEYKKDILPFFIGAILVFGISIILVPIAEVLGSLSTAT